MMRLLFSWMLLSLSFSANSQNVEFEDPNFKSYITSLGFDTNGDGEIQISEAELIEELRIEGSNATSIVGIKSFSNLRQIQFVDEFVDIDLSNMLNLDILDVDKFAPNCNLNASGCTAIDNINFFNTSTSTINSIDLSNCSSLATFNGDFSQINNLDFSNCTNLSDVFILGHSTANIIDFSNCHNLRSVNLDIQIPEITFDGLLALEDIHTMGDIQSIILQDLPELKFLNIFSPSNNGISITNCPSLENVYLESITLSDSLVFDNYQNLTSLSLFQVELDYLSAKNCPSLIDIDLAISNIREVDFSDCIGLETIWFEEVDEITLTNCISISELFIMPISSPIQKLDLSGLISLEVLDIMNVEEVILDGCFNLKHFTTYDLSPQVIDLSPCIFLEFANIYANVPIEYLILKNTSLETVNFFGGEEINNICVDADQYDEIEQLLVQHNISYDILTTTCPIVSAGRPYLITGTSLLDINNDSCKTSDVTLPFSKFEIIDSAGIEKNFFAGIGGKYKYALREGTYTYKPTVLYGNDLFTLAPLESTVTFPGSLSEINQNFCFHPEIPVDIIDVTLIPLEPARPGFDTRYLITYKNTGNVTRGGDIKLTFQEEFMDFIESTVEPNVQEEGFLSWAFEELIPYETRSIEFTMNLNSPMDTPPLNGGDFIDFQAMVGPLGNQTVSAYWSDLHQEIVNSFDPNDKTCLNGDVLEPSMIGDFVKYMIRFENTGTAEAVNIVVTDSIDGEKFDIRTLEVLNSSHAVQVETEGHVVDFVFKDIYLPFEDATNDGYITFKIKTWPTLTLGDDLRNKAEIYFDFNFPIITNTTSTIITDLSNILEVDNDIDASLSPNPTEGLTKISSQSSIDKVNLYNSSGSLVRSISNIGSTKAVSLSLSGLSAGLYFVHISGKDGSAIKKLVKK